jgi:hypothetical protein
VVKRVKTWWRPLLAGLVAGSAVAFAGLADLSKDVWMDADQHEAYLYVVVISGAALALVTLFFVEGLQDRYHTVSRQLETNAQTGEAAVLRRECERLMDFLRREITSALRVQPVPGARWRLAVQDVMTGEWIAPPATSDSDVDRDIGAVLGASWKPTRGNLTLAEELGRSATARVLEVADMVSMDLPYAAQLHLQVVLPLGTGPTDGRDARVITKHLFNAVNSSSLRFELTGLYSVRGRIPVRSE